MLRQSLQRTWLGSPGIKVVAFVLGEIVHFVVLRLYIESSKLRCRCDICFCSCRDIKKKNIYMSIKGCKKIIWMVKGRFFFSSDRDCTNVAMSRAVWRPRKLRIFPCMVSMFFLFPRRRLKKGKYNLVQLMLLLHPPLSFYITPSIIIVNQ